MPPPEDRRSPERGRAPAHRLRADERLLRGLYENISKGSTFIKTTRPLQVGSRCQFALSLPALPEPLLLDAEVTWTLTAEEARERGAEPGMGVRFVFQDQAARREFERTIERMMEQSLGADITQKLLRR